MGFKSFDGLRLFEIVARHLSFTRAAEELHVTKGALSYQIRKLERELGFDLFKRQHGTIILTPHGEQLLPVAREGLHGIEKEIGSLQQQKMDFITIGMSTYFASRWLSSRLMRFTSANADVGLRIQPTMGLIELEANGLDMAVRWGNGKWNDVQHELLFQAAAIPTAGKAVARLIRKRGLENALQQIDLLHDFEGSKAWQQWHQLAGLDYKDKKGHLVIPDPNVRVQAVIDNQGLALNDFLVEAEIRDGSLQRVTDVLHGDIALDDYGYYLVYPKRTLENSSAKLFRDWLLVEAGVGGKL